MGKKYRSDDRYNFVMRGNKQSYYPKKVVVSFSSPKGRFRKKPCQPCQQYPSIMPRFNDDAKFYTPCFIIPYKRSSDEAYLSKHKNKMYVYESYIPEEDILIPRPFQKDYCSVCELHFYDYLTHCRSDEHALALQESSFSRVIMRLCRKFQAGHRDDLSIKYSRSNTTNGYQSYHGEQSYRGYQMTQYSPYYQVICPEYWMQFYE